MPPINVYFVPVRKGDQFYSLPYTAYDGEHARALAVVDAAESCEPQGTYWSVGTPKFSHVNKPVTDSYRKGSEQESA